jgi:ribose 5-phosphate isomerase B
MLMLKNGAKKNIMQNINIAIGADHAGVDYKSYLIKELTALGYQTINLGTDSTDSMDYPDVAHPVANLVATKEATFGILICGSANGVAITANKNQNVRAALCWQNDVAVLSRQHNDANIICLPARFIAKELALQMVKLFLTTAFEGGRHQTRVNKISC